MVLSAIDHRGRLLNTFALTSRRLLNTFALTSRRLLNTFALTSRNVSMYLIKERTILFYQKMLTEMVQSDESFTVVLS